MKSSKTIASVVGVLFIMGTVSGVLSVVLSMPITEAPDILQAISANQVRFMAASLCILAMGLSLAMVPVVIYPVLKKHNPILAVGYVVFRGALETFTYFVMVIGWLTLALLSQTYSQAGGSDVLLLQSISQFVFDAHAQTGHLLKIVFPLGAMMLNIVLFQSKLVPRWLPIWGLFGVTLHMVEGLLTLFGVLPESAETMMAIPIAIQEMVFAIWLIVRGFHANALAAGAAHADENALVGVQIQS